MLRGSKVSTCMPPTCWSSAASTPLSCSLAEQVNVLWLMQILRAIGGSLQGVLSFSIVTFVFVILGLLEVEPLGRRLRRMGDGQGAGRQSRRQRRSRRAFADLHAGS